MIYVVTFVLVAFITQAIDYSKILRKEYRTPFLGIALYLIVTLSITFMIATGIIIFSDCFMQLIR